MIFGGHVADLLSAYCEEQLPPDETRRVAEHLSRCSACREALERVRFGVRLAAQLPRVASPPMEMGRRLKERIDGPGQTGPAVRGSMPLSGWATARLSLSLFALAACAFGALWFANRQAQAPPRLYVHAGKDTEIEALAREAHLDLLQGRASLDFEGSAPRDLEGWIAKRTGLKLEFPMDRAPDDAHQYALKGARALSFRGRTAVAVAYLVDSRPVTLVAARREDLSDPPDDGVKAKQISFHSENSGSLKLLTWGREGQAYSLVSDLPHYGQASCLLCHTDHARQRQILEMRPETLTD